MTGLTAGKFKCMCSLSIATTPKECDLWIKGINFLVHDTNSAPYPLQVERWLRKEFYSMENLRNT